jgi:outer membrane immunogenic protein
MKRLLTAACAITAGLTAMTAEAQERWPRWYLGLSGGAAFLNDADISGGTTGSAEYDTGFVGTVSLGYQPPATMQPLSNMRLEAELGYHYNEMDSTTLGGTTSPSSGNISAMSYMANAYYDFNNTSRTVPYIGGGVGMSRITAERGGNLALTKNDDNVFSWQLMAGLAYRPVSIPNTEWGIGYRYFVLSNPSFTNGSGRVEMDDVEFHNAEINAKFRF